MNTTATTSAPGESPRRGTQSPTAIVASAGLPEELGNLVLRVTALCRLWKRERADVARELCAHFQDGLESGASAHELAAAFGDPATAASLITPAKKRLRPAWWRAGRATLRGTGILLGTSVLLYGVLTVRYFMSEPRITHNFTKEANAATLATPEADRAWQTYRRAIISFGPLPEVFSRGEGGKAEAPGDPGWDEVGAWINSHQEAFALVREGATKREMGFVLHSDLSPEYMDLLSKTGRGFNPPPTTVENENPLLVGVLLPHLGELRALTRHLKADALHAVHSGDSERFLADTRAMLGMSEQLLREPFIISQLVGVAVADVAQKLIATHATRPNLLSDEELQQLAHTLAAFADGRIRIDARSERNMIDDVLQRFYSDDGNGDGRLVRSDQTEQMYRDFGVARPRAEPLIKAYQPVKSVIMPSRRELREMADRFTTTTVADEALPPWRHHERTSAAAYREIGNGGLYSALPILESLSGPPEQYGFEASLAKRDMFEARRDVTLTVIALELWHREHGSWPAFLHELMPRYLPRLPRDPFNGGQMQYLPPEQTDGAAAQPILYSVGADGVNDGGTAPSTNGGRHSAQSLQIMKDFRVPRDFTPDEEQRMELAKGDWIAWPEHIEE